jgi:FMN phosphatase YigB (HAD superfamily)
MIKAVFFDLGDTLCNYQAAAQATIGSACEYAVAHAPGLTAGGLREAYVREVHHAEEETRRWVATRLPTPSGVDEQGYRLWQRALEKCGVANPILAHAVALHYQLARMRALRLFPDALPALQALQGRVRVGVVAEGSPGIVNEELALLELKSLLSIVVVEGEAGFAKRDPRLFAHAVREAGCEPPQAAHVGDSLESDLAPARQAGLTTVWLDRSDHVAKGPEPGVRVPADAPDYVVSSLQAVPDLLLSLP